MDQLAYCCLNVLFSLSLPFLFHPSLSSFIPAIPSPSLPFLLHSSFIFTLANQFLLFLLLLPLVSYFFSISISCFPPYLPTSLLPSIRSSSFLSLPPSPVPSAAISSPKGGISITPAPFIEVPATKLKSGASAPLTHQFSAYRSGRRRGVICACVGCSPVQSSWWGQGGGKCGVLPVTIDCLLENARDISHHKGQYR